MITTPFTIVFLGLAASGVSAGAAKRQEEAPPVESASAAGAIPSGIDTAAIASSLTAGGFEPSALASLASQFSGAIPSVTGDLSSYLSDAASVLGTSIDTSLIPSASPSGSNTGSASVSDASSTGTESGDSENSTSTPDAALGGKAAISTSLIMGLSTIAIGLVFGAVMTL